MLANRLNSDKLTKEFRENMLIINLRAVYPAGIAFDDVGIVWFLECREYPSKSGIVRFSAEFYKYRIVPNRLKIVF